MSNAIKNIQLKFSCHENWDAMADTTGGRHCDKCQKKVYDFTDSKPEEFIRLMEESNYSICGRYRSEHVVVKPALLPFWKKWVSAAMVLVGFNLWGCGEKQQVLGKVKNPGVERDTSVHITMGEPMPPLPDSVKTQSATGSVKSK
jgi:hypothetical protein